MRVLTGILAAILALLLAFGGGLLVWGRGLPNVSDLDVLEFSGQSRVYARDGQFLGALSPSLASGYRVNRSLLKLNEVSPYLQGAVVTSEDRRFYQHHGIDVLGVARGLFKGLQGDLEGGSTLTQQLVKNTLLADLRSARTPERKFKEAILAVQVERNFDKKDILGAYLNVIYWGSGGRTDIIGAGNAARAYLDKNARDLNLAESVYLATLIPSPGRYFHYPDYRLLMRSLLDRMVEDGRVTRAQADAAWRYPLQPAGWRVRYDGQGKVLSARLVDREAKNRNTPAPRQQAHLHFLQAVERDVIERFGRKVLYTGGGLRIYTTMDPQAQEAAEQASRDARLPEGATLGIALVQPESGQVLALVGQKLESGRVSEWNNATQARRQVGSSVKPILYTLALEQGFKQSDTMLDAPLQGDYQPKNYDGTYLGRGVTLRYALDHSLNLPTVRLAQQIGLGKLERKVADLGMDVPENAGLSLAIGTLEASPLQMAAAYAAFANGGTWFEPTVLRRVVTARGAELPLPQPESRRVWDAQTAYLGLDMLRGVVNDLGRRAGGLAWRARIPGWDVGGKTGTTNDVKDLWFAGVTPKVAGAVWIGKQEGGGLPRRSYSGELAAPVWREAVAGALQGQSPVAFKTPPGIAYHEVRGVNMAFKEEESSGIAAGLRDFFGGRSKAAEPAPPPAPDPEPQVIPEPEPEAPAAQESAPTEEQQTPQDAAPQEGVQEGSPTNEAGSSPTEEPTLPQPEDLQPEPVPAPIPQDQPAEVPTTPEDSGSPTPASPTEEGTPVPPDVQPLPEDSTGGAENQDQGDQGTTSPDQQASPDGLDIP